MDDLIIFSTILSSQGITPFTLTKCTLIFDKESCCWNITEVALVISISDCHVRALDRFYYKVEGKRSEPKNVVIIFSSFHSIEQTFFSITS